MNEKNKPRVRVVVELDAAAFDELEAYRATLPVHATRAAVLRGVLGHGLRAVRVAGAAGGPPALEKAA